MISKPAREAVETTWYSEKLKRLATKLWKNRYIFFKADKNLSAEEKKTMQEVLQTQPEVSFLRGFLLRVWAIFESPADRSSSSREVSRAKEIRRSSGEQWIYKVDLVS